MEKETMIMGAAATAAQAEAHAAPVQQAPQARRPYEPPALQAVELGLVFADGDFVYSDKTADNDGPSGNDLWGSTDDE